MASEIQREREVRARPVRPYDRSVRTCDHPLCVEAQADGVPCTALGRRCEVCERAYVPAGTLDAW